jgi:hypothetical protein
MTTTKSGKRTNTTEAYKDIVFEYLRENHSVVSKAELRQNLDIADWYITQISSRDTFYTSLSHNGTYVASKYLVGRRSDHQGFWRSEVNDGTAVFHQDESTKPALTTLVRKRQSGLTAAEATELLGLDCSQQLADLADAGEIDRVELPDETSVYVHTWPSRREKQLEHRRTDRRIELDEPTPPEDEFLLRETVLQTFIDVVDSIDSAPTHRVAACLLR